MDKSVDKPNEKLERYLDQVCRGIAGPRALRQHVRQELREHLKDAIADHVAAGLSEEQAVDRALEDFGGPEVVRAELEATHGHRVMGVVIDKAMQWKERTVKAKWFWSTWTHVALGLVIAMELTFICGAMIFIVPKFEWYVRENMLGEGWEGVRPWLNGLLEMCRDVGENGVWILIGIALLWGLFEWRVRSERKPFIRLAAMGTAAVLLMATVVLTGFVLIVPLTIGIANMETRSPEQVVSAKMATIDEAISHAEQAIQAKDLQTANSDTLYAARKFNELRQMGVLVPVIVAGPEKDRAAKVRDALTAADEAMRELWQAEGVNGRSQASMQNFRDAYGKFKTVATTRPAQ